MKSSCHFSLERNRSYYITTRRKNSRGVLFLLILSLALLVYFAIPKVINSAPIAEFEPTQEQIIKVLPLPQLAKIKMAQHQTESEQEIQHLLNQPYLDPLTKYIEKHRLNKAKAPYVKKIKAERDRRCNDIDQRYRNMKKSYATFMKLKKGYGYSCPLVISGFADRLRIH